jgi:mRNA-degrading endonuclease RelE of RelBE toxin-antitoxin system
MDQQQGYKIIITSWAEKAYFEVLDYVFEHHPTKRANEIALELLEYPNVLSNFPLLGKTEPALAHRPEDYRFIIYERTAQATVKIIYYVDDEQKSIYLTDFFPCEMDFVNRQKTTKRKP